MNRPVPILALLLLAAACRSPQYVAQRDMPARGPDDSAQQPVVERNDGFTGASDSLAPADASTRPIGVFCEEIATAGAERESLGCLPLVSYGARAPGPYVSEYGVDLADQVAGWMRGRGFGTSVLTTPEMGARLDELLGERATLSTLETLRRHGELLELELVTFGTIRRDDGVGRPGRDVLTVDLQCYDFTSQRVLTRTTFEVPSDDAANERIWRLAQRTSTWKPDPR